LLADQVACHGVQVAGTPFTNTDAVFAAFDTPARVVVVPVVRK
jgi:hypothetical protein